MLRIFDTNAVYLIFLPGRTVEVVSVIFSVVALVIFIIDVPLVAAVEIFSSLRASKDNASSRLSSMPSSPTT